MQIPKGFISEDHANSALVLREDIADALRPLIERPPLEQAFILRRARFLQGRGPTPSLLLLPGLRVVLRTYRHGGMLQGLTRDLFVGLLPRPFRELAVSEHARARGIPTPPVLGAAVYPVIGPIYRGVIAVAEVEDARDGLSVLHQAESLSARQQRKLFQQLLSLAGRSVAIAHEGGLVHTDLNVKNLLFCPDPLSVYLLDLDACRLEPGPLSNRQRRSQLKRLLRSLEKLQRTGSTTCRLEQVDILHFLKGYAGASSLELRELTTLLDRWW